ncbi:uncharacterized protein LOC131683210 [Topomyia yanbarensis]|uniref:uncharacterized protein LOC131683210 n=1 Tax=Topomyia yanbarensis TaxID=2498891 RepID=UPI00273AF036|nr:uncharacterized protein LOC131683210 [Topomyia yanbarensis]
MDVGRDFIHVISRLMSNHYTGLAKSGICACGNGYHDIEHIVWACAEYCSARSQLLDPLWARGRSLNIPVRDILASRDLLYMSLIILRSALFCLPYCNDGLMGLQDNTKYLCRMTQQTRDLQHNITRAMRCVADLHLSRTTKSSGETPTGSRKTARRPHMGTVGKTDRWGRTDTWLF